MSKMKGYLWILCRNLIWYRSIISRI